MISLKILEQSYTSKSWTIVKEGDTQILVPSLSLEQKEPSKFPAFFNPAAKFNRDVSIMLYKNFIQNYQKKVSFIDSLSGVGSRGLRVAKEIPKVSKVIFNDLNVAAIQSAKSSAVLNNVFYKCLYSNNEICKFLQNFVDHPERGTIIDLDPFGSPVQYLDCVLRSIENGGLVSITATDTAVLLGVYPKVCHRKYYGIPIRTKYSLEIGTRILLSCIALVASRLDLSIKPVFAHSYRNYIRVYCRVNKSNRLANRVYENIGYIEHCSNCGHRQMTKYCGTDTKCRYCLRRSRLAGPLWVSEIYDKNLIDVVIKNIREDQMKIIQYDDIYYASNEIVEKFFTIAKREIDSIPFHFLSDEFGKLLRSSTLAVGKIVQGLQEEGHLSSLTIFSPTGFKTTAHVSEIRNVICKISSR